MNQNLSDALRAVASALQTPVIIILFVLIAVTVVMLGTLLAEWLTERRHMKVKLPELLNALEKKEKPLPEIITESGLLKRQRAALLTVCAQTELTPLKREDVYTIEGAVMNREYGLTGTNAYPDTGCTLVCVKLADMEHPRRVAIPRFQIGGRWFYDIVENNRAREEAKRTGTEG